MSEREKGTVKWFNGEKGFGFIAPKMVRKMFSSITALFKSMDTEP